MSLRELCLRHLVSPACVEWAKGRCESLPEMMKAI